MNNFLKVGFFKSKALYRRYERWLTPAAFFVGFAWDHFTLRMELWWQNLVFLGYIIIAGTNILLMNMHGAGKLQGKLFDKYKTFAPYIFQFIFGGLFSAFLVFYSRSASIFASWPFLLFLAAFFVGNEFIKKKYLRLTFQISVFFIVLFSYAVFALPLIFGTIGNFMFILSGLAALGGVSLVLYLSSRLIPELLQQNKRSLILSIAILYLLFQVFYFTNIIPPIPLALKESGVYHSIERIGEKQYIYRVSYEPAPWYLFFQEQSGTMHLQGEKVYFYSAVFAPAKFSMPIYHHWFYLDEKEDKWLKVAKVDYPIIGGRDGGYRGYSYKTNIQPGKWRVQVTTEDGKVLGRRDFKIVRSEAAPALKTAQK